MNKNKISSLGMKRAKGSLHEVCLVLRAFEEHAVTLDLDILRAQDVHTGLLRILCASRQMPVGAEEMHVFIIAFVAVGSEVQAAIPGDEVVAA